jgi:hypothetical protein
MVREIFLDGGDISTTLPRLPERSESRWLWGEVDVINVVSNFAAW